MLLFIAWIMACYKTEQVKDPYRIPCTTVYCTFFLYLLAGHSLAYVAHLMVFEVCLKANPQSAAVASGRITNCRFYSVVIVDQIRCISLLLRHMRFYMKFFRWSIDSVTEACSFVNNVWESLHSSIAKIMNCFSVLLKIIFIMLYTEVLQKS
jgi:hypothetical protein